MGTDRPLLLFLGHHRCGTSWITDVFRMVARELKLRHFTAHHARLFGYDLEKFAEETGTDCIAYINADYRYVQPLRNFRAFHVVRDPRDVSVSAYFSHLYSHEINDEWPELRGRRQRLQESTKDEGLLAEMAELGEEFRCMREWDYTNPSILDLKFETLIADPYLHFLEIFRFLGLLSEERLSIAKRTWHLWHRILRSLESVSGGRISFPAAPERLSAERILGIVWENDFDKKAKGRKPGQEDSSSHYRKGVAGDWRNHLKPHHLSYLKEHYGDVLVTLGYE